MQFQVPQNIAMEDRIVGPLTALQFGIVVIGGGIAFFVGTSTLIPSPVNTALGIMLGLVTVVLALGKFNDQPLYRFIRFIISFVIKPRTRVWHKGGAEVTLVQSNPQRKSTEAPRREKHVTKDDIARLALVLDSRGGSGLPPTLNPQTPQSPPN